MQAGELALWVSELAKSLSSKDGADTLQVLDQICLGRLEGTSQEIIHKLKGVCELKAYKDINHFPNFKRTKRMLSILESDEGEQIR